MFSNYINNDKLRLVNEINTISKNLCSIFNISNKSDDSERFSSNASNGTSIYASITKDKIHFCCYGIDKYRISADRKATQDNVKNALITKLKTQSEYYVDADFNRVSVTIMFDSLDDADVIKDIMTLMNEASVPLRPTKTGSF